MPEGDQGVGSREREQQNLGKASPSQNPTPRQDFAAPLEQYPPSAASMMASAQRTPPAFFCSQQTPHRVQSSTNLDLVDCVGSDLLMAMNSLDISEQQQQARAAVVAAAAAAGAASGSGTANHHTNNGLLSGDAGEQSVAAAAAAAAAAAHAEGFLPLAALAPPPARQPAWLTAQQQQARVQNEHFPSRIYRTRSDDVDRRGSDSSSVGVDWGIRNDGGCGRAGEFDSYDSFLIKSNSSGHGSTSSAQSSVGSSSAAGARRTSPGAAPPPGFGIVSAGCNGGEQGGSTLGSSLGSSLGLRLSQSGGRSTPHLDESWTAVLNSPAGAELMEFLTERASRALVLWNVESVAEKELRAACEAYGSLYYLRAEHRRKKVVFLAYYDMRDAVNAHQSLGKDLARHVMNEHGGRPLPAVHFSVELHAGFSYKEGSVVVHNVPAQATEADVAGVFQIYGDLVGIQRHSGTHQGHPASFSVDFCSIQDARVAAQELTVRNPWGHTITVEPVVRSEGERTLGRRLHATLNRWTAEAPQAQSSSSFGEHRQHQHHHQQHQHHVGMRGAEDRPRSASSSVILSGRSSDSDSPPPKPEDYGRDLGYMMESYTPITSANTTPATTPGSTPPSGTDANYYLATSGGGKSPGLQYMTMHLRQQYSGSAGPLSSSASSTRGADHHNHGQGHHRVNSSPGSVATTSGSSSAGAHSMYSAASPGFDSSYPGGGHHHHHHHHPSSSRRMYAVQHKGDLASSATSGNGTAGKPHPLASPIGPAPYSSSSPGANGYYVDVSPGWRGGASGGGGEYDDDRSPPAPMWAASLSLSPPSAGNGGGMRGSPPLRGIPGGVHGCHNGGAGGAGGLGYKDRSRQTSLDEGRVCNGGGGGTRSGRSNSDSAQAVLSSPGPGCGVGGGGNGGDEFSLDLKKVSKGLEKRTTVMVRNIPNKYTQSMLLQEIDASYRGAYDFFYLPIDFKNRCNVGYAFINFMDYRRIVPFFREFNGQRWKNFNSEKVCAISYARIQGKASMISRFQNSSLMEKDGEYRPLIFHSSGADRGRPEPFPASSKVYRGVVSGSSSSGGAGYGGGRDRERAMSASSSLIGV